MRLGSRIAAVWASLAFVAVAGGAEASRADSRPPDVTTVRLPLGFEPNRGQAADEVEFLARGRGYAMALTRGDAVLALGGTTVRMRAVGANAAPRVAAEAPLPGRVHYLAGRDSTGWRTDIPTYARVLYRDVYPAIDLLYHGRQGHLEYDFLVAPGADPTAIRLAFDGADGLALEDDGTLRVATPGGALLLPKPTIYQERDGVREEIAGGFVLQGTDVTFWLAPYDRTRPLVIDPVLAWSSSLGRGRATAIAVDAAGDVYVTGETTPYGFPATPGTVQPWANSICLKAEVFVAKLAGDGSGLLWATYLGGTRWDAGLGIAVDAAGQVYVTGSTSSRLDFPTTPGAFRPTSSRRPAEAGGSGGGSGYGYCRVSYDPSDGFIAKLSADGSALVYGSLLGGGAYYPGSGGAAIAVDRDGNAYVTGTFGANSPAQYHFGTGGGAIGAFVLKFDPAGALVYSADFGTGSGTGIAVDGAGHAYITGLVGESPAFPTVNALQPDFGGGDWDAFVAKLTPDGSALVYSTYLGGSSDDRGVGIVVDAAGQVYLAGSTRSADFPTTPGALAAGEMGGAFVTKLDAKGARLAYSAVIADGWATALAVDPSGSAYVTGNAGAGFPTVDPVQAVLAGMFVAKLNQTGSALGYSTYLGGSGHGAGGIALGEPGTAYVAGTFVAKLVESTPPAAQPPLVLQVRPTTVFLNRVAPGDTQTIYTQVWASAAASGILVHLEIYDASGAKIAQQIYDGQSFATGQARAYYWNLPMGATFPEGTYTVKVGVFSGDWSHLYTWVDQAATFVVDPAAPVLGFTIGAVQAWSHVVYRADPGAHVGVTLAVTASRLVSHGTVKVAMELYDPSGERVAQRTHSTIEFRYSRHKGFQFKWDVPATALTGRYTVAVSVFNGDRSIVYAENAQAGSVVVEPGRRPVIGFTIGAGLVTPNPVPRGQRARVEVPVTASGTAPASLIQVNLSLYDSSGTRWASTVARNLTFAAGQTLIVPWDFDPVRYGSPLDLMTPHTHRVAVEVFSAGESIRYAEAPQAATFILTGPAPPPPPPPTRFDFDGDGKADLGVYRRSTAEWLVLGSATGAVGPVVFGSPDLGDIPVGADYDGDGKTDLAVYRRATGEWLIFGSATGFTGAVALGCPSCGDVPVAADYDGDGLADRAVYRTTTAQWFILGSATGFTGAVTLGSPGLGDVPVPADYDGDGKTDLAVFRTTTAQWFIFGSATGFTGAVTLGSPGLGDVPVPADYDGDGKADLGVYRPGTAEWFIFGSATGFNRAVTVGWPGLGDVPVPADYDGDGKTDLAVFRMSSGEWFVVGSAAGFRYPVALGSPTAGDTPLPGR